MLRWRHRRLPLPPGRALSAAPPPPAHRHAAQVERAAAGAAQAARALAQCADAGEAGVQERRVPPRAQLRAHERLGQLPRVGRPDGLAVEEGAAAAHCARDNVRRREAQRRAGAGRAATRQATRQTGRQASKGWATRGTASGAEVQGPASATAHCCHHHANAQPQPCPSPPAWYVSPRMGLSTTPTTGCLPMVSPTLTQLKGKRCTKLVVPAGREGARTGWTGSAAAKPGRRAATPIRAAGQWGGVCTTCACPCTAQHGAARRSAAAPTQLARRSWGAAGPMAGTHAP